MSVKKMDLGGSSKASVETAGSTDIIGIDLGTTNSAVAIYNAGTVPTLLPIGGPGKFTVPSCVRWDGFNEEKEPFFTVGEEAYKERFMPDVIYSIKRMMGSGEKVTFYSRTVKQVDDSSTSRESLTTTPAAVSAEILKYIKNKVAELYRPVTRCIITVPAYFDQRQMNDTIEAAKWAGLECVQILKEPTSASYIYSQLGYAQSGSVLIYDLGGGTFDVTHMNFLRKDSIPKTMLTSLKRQYGIELKATDSSDINDQYFCRVLGTYGDVHLGGDDIDRVMGDAVVAKCGVELSDTEKEELYLRCESFKKLSSGASAMDVVIGGKKIHLDRESLDAAVDEIFGRTMALMSEIDISDVSSIVLVGGSTKSERLREDLAKAFPNVEISAVLDPDATVALGAGSVAKAVANKSGLMYADVLPLPIGILVEEKEVRVCIPRNTSMPHVATEYFYTLHDQQSRITLHVFQGLSTDPAEDTYLGKLVLEDIPAKPAGEVCVAVSFMLNDQGRLRIVSSIEGRDREEELLIDNIFDVKDVDNAFAATKAAGDNGMAMTPEDDFEACFLPLFADKTGSFELFTSRREAKARGDVSAVEEFEALILAAAQS